MLATRFSNRRRVTLDQRGNVLSEDVIRRAVPSVFAEEAHGSRSGRYTYIPTAAVMGQLTAEGWVPTFAVQAKPRDENRIGFAKHMLRFRHQSADLAAGEVPELVLINSHDGTTGYQLLGGYFRFLCSNGLVVGNGYMDIRVRHSGRVLDEVTTGAAAVLEHFGQTGDQVRAMKALQLSASEQIAFAQAAVNLRWNDAVRVEPADVLRPRRSGDESKDLWTTFNRIQENVIRGGVPVRSVSSPTRNARARAVQGIADHVRLNRALWTLADEMSRGDHIDAA